MTTVTQSPIASLFDNQPIPLIPQRRRRHSVEIIDISSDNETEVGMQPRARRRLERSAGEAPLEASEGRSARRRSRASFPVTISLLDSDEEGVVVPNSPRHGLRLVSPPPPPPSTSALPPVPAIPRRFTFLPMRRPSPTVFPSPPVIRPIERPFDFEDLPRAGPSMRTRRFDPDMHGSARGSLQPAPPSHHIPLMGFGGAILTQNRAEQERSRINVRRPISNRRSWWSRILSGPGLENMAAIEQILMANEQEGMVQREWQARKDPALLNYKSSYTHPNNPDAGFTFDFGPPSLDGSQRHFPETSKADPIIIDDDTSDPSTEDVGGSNSSSSNFASGSFKTLLVCAGCLDPLVLSASLTPEQSKQRRVWGLRCGHLIDEKCLDALAQPSEVVPKQTSNVKGKGKAKEVDVEDAGYPSGPKSLEHNNDNDIRSRLRSRPSDRPSGSRSSSGSKQSIIENKKRRATVSRVEESYEWSCPVVGCERTHFSVRVAGVWGPERSDERRKGVLPGEERGAIPVFA